MTDTHRKISVRTCQRRRALIRTFLLVALAVVLLGLAGLLMLSEDSSQGDSRTENGIWNQDTKPADAFHGW